MDQKARAFPSCLEQVEFPYAELDFVEPVVPGGIFIEANTKRKKCVSRGEILFRGCTSKAAGRFILQNSTSPYPPWSPEPVRDAQGIASANRKKDWYSWRLGALARRERSGREQPSKAYPGRTRKERFSAVRRDSLRNARLYWGFWRAAQDLNLEPADYSRSSK